MHVIMAAPAKTNWGGDEFLPKFCEICPNREFFYYLITKIISDSWTVVFNPLFSATQFRT